MATDAEAAFGSDNDSREDNKVQGYLTRGMGEWIKATAQAHAPVPAGFRTPAAAIDTTATASVDEDDIRNVLQEMHVQSKSAEDMDGFVGIGLKRRFADFPNYLPSSNSTQASGIVHEAMYNKEIMRQVDVYKTDAGTLRLHPHFWLAAFNPSAVVQQNRGYFLHRSRWELRWNQKPKVYRPEFKGGSYEVALDMILMLCAKNVRAEGKIAPTA
jgi:hypothetical protein